MFDDLFAAAVWIGTEAVFGFWRALFADFRLRTIRH